MDEAVAIAGHFHKSPGIILGMGGDVSEQQWRDVLGVMKVQADRLDLACLRQWAAQLNLSDLLERAIKEAGFLDADKRG